MTPSILKCLEKIIANRISPLIKKYTTDLQGGGKQNESTVEYLFMLQTAIDKNKKHGKDTKLIITDVSKAFDQAWRIGVFGNLAKRNIKGRMLRLIWEINNDLKARIKFDEEQYSQTFEVEDSIRQGSGLSAILYAQHAAKIIEDLEEIDNGIKIGGRVFPAIGWQDDITVIISDREEEERITEILRKSAVKNRITFSEEKCKVLIIGKKHQKKDHEFYTTKLGEVEIKDTKEEKVLGHFFNEENNNIAHINKKETEIINMVAALGLTLQNGTLANAQIQALIIIYKKSILPKLIFGMAAFATTKQEDESFEKIVRQIIRNFANLPISTPKVALYNEFGILPAADQINKMKLMMWHKMNEEKSNEAIKAAVKEQVESQLPWVKQIIKVALKYDIDLTIVKQMSKNKWKNMVTKRIKECIRRQTDQQRNESEKYIATDKIVVGQPKRYMRLERKAATAIMRARSGQLDPTPRKPYWKKKWRCAFCLEKEQSTRHYVLSCKGTQRFFADNDDRKKTWQRLIELEGTEEEIITLGGKMKKIYKHICEQAE